mmetsp:Transcript_53592/g.116837  ORF Transcript_53592/g.116837 Transcript_53592/m.116837 type:complete len:94 (+) Transcript_53592:861-1142(+)
MPGGESAVEVHPRHTTLQAPLAAFAAYSGPSLLHNRVHATLITESLHLFLYATQWLPPLLQQEAQVHHHAGLQQPERAPRRQPVPFRSSPLMP